MADQVIKGARFSDCGKYRYYLSRIWDEQLPHAMVIGLNPSTANEQDDDPTIRALITMLRDYGYGGFYMLNLFGYITTDPEKLRECPNPVGEQDYYLRITRRFVADVIFAWGAFKQAEYRAKKIKLAFPEALCFGKTNKGNPIHPLAAQVWLKSKCTLQPFSKEVRNG
jgi:hypothetical protein